MSNKHIKAIDASTLFYNLFFKERKHLSLPEYLENSFFDASGIIDLNKDKYTILNHIKNKYYLPLQDGSYSKIYEYMVNLNIHEDDIEIVKKVFDPKTILVNLYNSNYPNFIFVHYRMKLTDGTYRWVEHAIISGEENGIERGIIRFYIYDIENVKSRELGFINDEKNSLNRQKDEITSLFTRETFFEQSYEYNENHDDLCMIAIDIEHFKLFDEWYGRDNGTMLISDFGKILLDYVTNNGGIAGYFGQDDFAVIAKLEPEKFVELYNQLLEKISSFGYSVGFIPLFGICKIDDAHDINDAYQKATICADRAKNDFKDKIHYYDPKVRITDEEEYHLLIQILEGLKNEEFTFYLQPQVRISTGKIVGAEALARWIKKDGTLISPIKFIPILEKFGFIANLDKYIWEKVFKFIKDCLDKGIDLVPISINVSRIDIFTIDVLDFLNSLVKKYTVPVDKIKVEITESAFADTPEKITKLINDLREKGFLVLMDDFGSGYSSLNMLSNVKMDVIKLDALFLSEKTEDLKKSMNILESVVNMAKTIGIPIIVEGVENNNHKQYLEDLGCRYAQGFHFYKPMPKEEFLKLMNDPDHIDRRGFVVKLNEQFRIREFLDENIYSDSMLNNILGPVAIYDLKDEHINIVRFNEQFYEAVDVPDFSDRLKDIQRFMPEKDIPLILTAFEDAIKNKFNGSIGHFHFYKTDGTLTDFYIHFYYLGEQSDGHHRFYGSASNVTQLTDLIQQMSLISDFSSDTIIFLKKKNDEYTFEVGAHGLKNAIEMDKNQLEKELNDWSFFSRLKEGDEKNLANLFKKYINNKISFSTEITYLKDNKEEVKIEMTADPVTDLTNNVIYILTYRKTN